MSPHKNQQDFFKFSRLEFAWPLSHLSWILEGCDHRSTNCTLPRNLHECQHDAVRQTSFSWSDVVTSQCCVRSFLECGPRKTIGNFEGDSIETIPKLQEEWAQLVSMDIVLIVSQKKLSRRCMRVMLEICGWGLLEIWNSPHTDKRYQWNRICPIVGGHCDTFMMEVR